MSRYTEEYGQRLNTARVAVGITQTQLAERLGLTRSSIANIEAGRQSPSAEQVVDTATALGCDPRWLLTGWEPGRPPIQPKPRVLAEHVAALRKLADRLETAATPTPDSEETR
jgi:transcriptional regulator with XRE-family HTH domain